MKVLVIFVLVLSLINGEKLNMLKSNKTPKKPYNKNVENTAVCDECKVIITRFAAALEDPEKVNELKAILRMLCHETSYVEECKLFVSRLDYFIAHIQTYLKDPENACKHLRMCANRRIETFHRKSMLYFNSFNDKKTLAVRFFTTDHRNSLLCEECEFAVDELKRVVDEKKSQQKVKQFLSEEICSRLGKYQGSCDVMLNEFLPTIFEELDKMLSDGKEVSFF
uniref:Saposin B-type domain-containing protein n=1 Tax=Syphacia muris TaxID=451379 RepID=A0A0N5APH4_9BILA